MLFLIIHYYFCLLFIYLYEISEENNPWGQTQCFKLLPSFLEDTTSDTSYFLKLDLSIWFQLPVILNYLLFGIGPLPVFQWFVAKLQSKWDVSLSSFSWRFILKFLTSLFFFNGLLWSHTYCNIICILQMPDSVLLKYILFYGLFVASYLSLCMNT